MLEILFGIVVFCFLAAVCIVIFLIGLGGFYVFEKAIKAVNKLNTNGDKN